MQLLGDISSSLILSSHDLVLKSRIGFAILSKFFKSSKLLFMHRQFTVINDRFEVDVFFFSAKYSKQLVPVLRHRRILYHLSTDYHFEGLHECRWDSLSL